ncbi:heavy metal translocating P-type ATPase [Phyllobacterium lublinensis]|uniref:heavy metal translocating P-type ATPase n=1 Tax=Phyllobacterium lublinensis TaxID=2875708 RepID=UPI001CCE4014|nr:heavy metal translocating P-type ATPase [Phyllobacterium sp. 2063]MBZ9656440.1 cadmium-translocating P-type ATPase [Phyllobacterium sp. 2063]
MTCCTPATPLVTADAFRPSAPWAEELRLASRRVGDGILQTEISVPSIHCGGCINKIERGLTKLDGVQYVRVNLSSKRLVLRWSELGPPPDAIGALKQLGFNGHLFDPTEAAKPRGDLPRLIRALAVAAFASMNIMSLSVSVWAGAEGSTRDILHWICAAIALPALLYSGRVFYESAWRSLWHGQTNMDVPISIGIAAAFSLSVYDSYHGYDHAYFDAATSLVFFLLIGRTLDYVMRERARTAVKGLAQLSPRGAMTIKADGEFEYLPLKEIRPGTRLLITAGERVPVDCAVDIGISDVDFSLVTGESAPRKVESGAVLQAGTLNITGSLTVVAAATAEESFLAEMIRLMEAAESGKSVYRRIADRASVLYAPAVHMTSLLSFLGWMVIQGDVHQAATIAIAVLIITCPCALGLAVPMVQVVAACRLFENRIMVRDGSAMERLNEINTVIFDKTGTLTLGELQVANIDFIDPDALSVAAGLASHSRHPNARAICAAASVHGATFHRFDEVKEYPGLGLEGIYQGKKYRMGRSLFACGTESNSSDTVLTCEGRQVAAISFSDKVRPGAKALVDKLRSAGISMEIVSGDGISAVRKVADELGITYYTAGVLPGGKLDRVKQLCNQGRKVLMVGDGLNDAPALMAAHVSMAPANAADVGRNNADFVFLQDSLDAVFLAYRISRDSGKLIRQNFVIAIGYNVLALPVAILGYATPFVAALAMSLSSIVVVANAMRLKGAAGKGETKPFGRKLQLGRMAG